MDNNTRVYFASVWSGLVPADGVRRRIQPRSRQTFLLWPSILVYATDNAHTNPCPYADSRVGLGMDSRTNSSASCDKQPEPSRWNHTKNMESGYGQVSLHPVLHRHLPSVCNLDCDAGVRCSLLQRAFYPDVWAGTTALFPITLNCSLPHSFWSKVLAIAAAIPPLVQCFYLLPRLRSTLR